MRKMLLLSCLLLGVPSAEAGQYFDNGNQMLATCTNPRLSDVCLAFVAGLASGLNVARVRMGEADCVTGPVTWDQARDVIVRFLQNHPEIRHYRAPALATMAVEEAWCPSNDSPTVSHIPEQPKPKWQPVPVKKPAKPLPLDTE